MKNNNRYICFKIQDGRKIPINPKTGKNAKCNDPSTWGSYEEAQKALKKYKCTTLGIALGDGVQGIDIDHCIDDKGNISELAQKILSRYKNTYAETSPSGSGIHILAKGNTTSNIKTNEIEVYGGLRFFTLTGNRLNKNTLQDCDFESLINELEQSRSHPSKVPRNNRDPYHIEIKNPIPNLPSDRKLDMLMKGMDLSGDKSLDDLSLIGLLKQRGYSRTETEKIIRQVRYRPKFDKVTDRYGRTYLERTLDYAFRN